MVRPDLFEQASAIRERFDRAMPFKHAVIDEFFEPGIARALLERFPAPHDARDNPYGAPGRKSFHSDLSALPEPYPAAHAFFGSRTFLDWVEQATGISGLLYDENNFGGGTHENFDGRDLRPHVDFNVHPITKLHRRLNLIVYLNENWEASWGGAIALHRDPRSASNEVVEYAPSFNRCIIFETSEHSWHGFEKIDLPPDHKHRSRKSISIYLYSRERAAEDIYREHTTFFVPRPLPSHFVRGHTLTDDDERDLEELIGHRDRLIELYQSEQRKQTDETLEIARLRIQVADLQARRTIPLMGYAVARNADGLYADGWAGASVDLELCAERDVTGVRVRFRTPPGIGEDATLTIAINGDVVSHAPIAHGFNEIGAVCSIEAGACARVRISSSATANPKRLGMGPDERDLGLYVERIVLEHAPLP